MEAVGAVGPTLCDVVTKGGLVVLEGFKHVRTSSSTIGRVGNSWKGDFVDEALGIAQPPKSTFCFRLEISDFLKIFKVHPFQDLRNSITYGCDMVI